MNLIPSTSGQLIAIGRTGDEGQPHVTYHAVIAWHLRDTIELVPWIADGTSAATALSDEAEACLQGRALGVSLVFKVWEF
jgi:hypothetical protein